MNAPYFALVLSLTILASPSALAKISAINHSGTKLRLSFHGVGCRYHDNSGYAYPACAEREIEANATAVFAEILDPDLNLTKREQLLSARVIFSSLGFSYVCKLVFFSLLRVCRLHDDWFDMLQTCTRETVSPAEVPEEASHLVLSSNENYAMEIGTEWGFMPRPWVSCRVMQIKVDASVCATL